MLTVSVEPQTDITKIRAGLRTSTIAEIAAVGKSVRRRSIRNAIRPSMKPSNTLKPFNNPSNEKSLTPPPGTAM